LKARFASAAFAVGLVVAGAGCSSGTQIGASSEVTVYVSLPLRGASGQDGRDAADGARLALKQADGKAGGLAVRAVYLDDTRGSDSSATWSSAQAGENARRATEDSTAIAYIGDFESGATRTSEPITNEARLLQVSPASSAVELTRPFAGSEELPVYETSADERTFGRVIPDDDAQGRAAGNWARKLGFKHVGFAVQSKGFSDAVEAGFGDTAGSLVVSRRPFDAMFDATSGQQPAAIYTGPDGFKGPVLGTDGLLAPWRAGPPTRLDYATSAALDPSQLPATGQKFVRDFRSAYDRACGRYAAYGYEAMAVVLNSIDRSASDTISRQGVIDAFFETLDRHSILGTYSIDAVGNTTLDRMTGYRIKGGRPAAVAELRSR
jgi:branched-chain amino acid transport system substrate-binding protein